MDALGRMTADSVVLIHAAWIAFLVAGILVAGDRAWVQRLHLAALATNVGIDLAGLDCPLTALERALRLRYDPPGWYPESFLQHYLGVGLGPGMSPELIRWLGIGLLIATGAVYRLRARAPAPPSPGALERSRRIAWTLPGSGRRSFGRIALRRPMPWQSPETEEAP
jgi:hypothetical protein